MLIHTKYLLSRGNSGFWKDLLDSIAVCSTGCSTGEKTEKKKSVSSDQSQSTVKP